MEKKTLFIFDGLVINDKNEILVDCRKGQYVDEKNPVWELPGGRIEFGEAPEEAVVREVFEETGYQVEIIKMIPKVYSHIFHYPNCEQHTLVYTYLCRLKTLERVVTQDEEVACIRWIKLEEVCQFHWLPGTVEFIKEGIALL